MYTLVDSITHIKGVEYIVSILAIGGFLLFWEVMKAKPFHTVISTGREDIAYIQRTGYGDIVRNIGKIAAAPFIGLAYLVMVPVGLAAALSVGVINLMLKGMSGFLGLLGLSMSFEWRPMEAYFSGKKRPNEAREK